MLYEIEWMRFRKRKIITMGNCHRLVFITGFKDCPRPYTPATLPAENDSHEAPTPRLALTPSFEKPFTTIQSQGQNLHQRPPTNQSKGFYLPESLRWFRSGTRVRFRCRDGVYENQTSKIWNRYDIRVPRYFRDRWYHMDGICDRF